jgi:hypothetical protein
VYLSDAPHYDKYCAWLERLARDKQSSLLGFFVKDKNASFIIKISFFFVTD